MNERMFECAAQDALLDWYAAGHRELPWRHTRDPYRILLSEIMLQQTQAERVVPKYQAFLERFPTLQALADAPSSEVIRAWSGLGYNRRALNLQRACRAVVEEHGGVMPRTVEELARLPGVGPYTAGAVACFAFDADVGFVDTNIRRVLQRVVAGPDVPQPPLSERETRELAQRSVPPGRGHAWNQALMELGATLCRARATECQRCPVARWCAARPTIQTLLAQTPRAPARRPTPRFEETSRYFRGRIVGALGEHPAGLSLAQLGARLKSDFAPADAPWLLGLVDGLTRDGLIAPVANGLREETVSYDGAVDLTRRYTLPT
jgi:A/G-specific adenine glycosylase